MGRLTTHVLDLASGKPAQGLLIELRNGAGQVLKKVVTNSDGRVDGPLLEGAQLVVGRYELRFFVADYFAAKGQATSQQPFLDEVPIVFGVDDANAHYHVPLLLSPFGYSTYRGS